MQGVQPRPNRKPSSGAAASPTAGTGAPARRAAATAPARRTPGRAGSSATPSTTRELARARSTSQAPTAPDSAPSATKTDGEAEHEQQRAGEHPAAPRASVEVGAGQAGGVGEVARQQRDHARREERHQPGDQRDRDREQQRAGGRVLAGTSHPSAASGDDVLDDVDAASCVDGQRRRGCWRRPGPRGRGPRCVGIACGGERRREREQRLAVRVVERRVRRRRTSARSACACVGRRRRGC